MRIYLALLLVITSAVQSQDVRLIAKSTYQRDITDITKEIFRRSDSLHLAYSAKNEVFQIPSITSIMIPYFKLKQTAMALNLNTCILTVIMI